MTRYSSMLPWDETVRASQKAFDTHCFYVSVEINSTETILVCDAKKQRQNIIIVLNI